MSAVFVVSVGCTFVCGICRSESGMSVVIGQCTDHSTLSSNCIRTGGPSFWGLSDTYYARLSQKQSENSSKSSDDASVSSITPECEQRPT